MKEHDPFRDRIYWDEEQFPTDPYVPEQGAWVCSSCGNSSKHRRRIAHASGCKFHRKRTKKGGRHV